MSQPRQSKPLPSIPTSLDVGEVQALGSEPHSSRASKMGRPNQWTNARSRKLARVYLNTTLPTKDIGRVLKDDNWQPSKESTIKTVSSLLDSQPRWLRPKNREEMEQRIAGISDCQANGNAKRAHSQPGNNQPNLALPLEPNTWIDFSETPLEDLLALAPEVPLCSIVGSSISGGLPANLRAESLACSSTASLRGRLSQYSAPYIKSIARLLGPMSIADNSSAALTFQINDSLVPVRRTSSDDALVGCDTITSFTAETLVSPAAALNLNLYLQNQGICMPGFKSHDTKSCWCAVRDELVSKGQLWDWDGTPTTLSYHNVRFEDAFGNTALHLLAARGATSSLMTEAIRMGLDPNAQNTAGETFLHVLHPTVFRQLAQDWGSVEWTMFVTWLQSLNQDHHVRFDLYDHQGRSFYHIISRHAKDSNITLLLLPQFIYEFPSSKDVSGWEPHPSLRMEAYGDRIRRLYSGDLRYRIIPRHNPSNSPENLDLSEDVHNSPIHDERLITKHARLLETARLALTTPQTRNAEGSNGLHCLAEALLAADFPTAVFYDKRKRNQRLQTRCEVVEQLVVAGVELNDYDDNGSTVLMSFITHLHDGEDDKTLAMLLELLIRSGANVYWRNREGETALHVAVGLGHKIATRVLLEHGANVHARNSEEEGVLAMGEKHYLRARDDPQLYASIMACMALAIRYGAVATPTFVQEWSRRDT